MRSKVKWIALGSAAPAVAFLSDGCRTATQITVDVGTNVVCSDMRGVEIVVAGNSHDAERRAALDAPGTRYATATTSACTEGTSPRKVGTLAITPGEGDGAIVVITAFGNTRLSECQAPNFAAGCIVARRRFGFVDRTAVTLPIVLDPVCAGVPCNESSTCVGKKCVDSKVDCASGTCADPGQVSPDGGLVEVDGASPLDAAIGEDAGQDANGPDGGPADGAVEGGDGGRVCPASSHCGGTNPSTCASSGWPKACCYTTDPASCTPLGSCPAFSGCCRSSADCSGSDICCASTLTASTTTVVSCKPRAECEAASGKVVCAEVGDGGCGGSVCIGSTYSNSPRYYDCS